LDDGGVTVKQFTIFIKNKIGELEKISEAIGKKGINIKTIVGEATLPNPYVKLVTTDIQTTKKVLDREGFKFELKEILTIEIPDKPGELSKIAKRLARANINVESIYIMGQRKGRTEVALIVDDMRIAKKALKL